MVVQIVSVGPGAAGIGQTFNADTIQKVVVEIGPARIAGRDRTTGLGTFSYQYKSKLPRYFKN